MNNRKLFSFFVGLAFALVAGAVPAATFNLFSPASGVLKGNPNTYVTTPADASDVISLWSGTCNASSFLRGDGSCVAPVTAPGGSNTQVQFNDGGVFGGDAGLTYNKTTDALSVGSLLTGVVTAPSGLALSATGANSITLATNGSTRYTVDSSGTLLVNGSAGTNGQVLTTSGPGAMPAWTTVSGGGSGANPTATIGLSAVNGSAGTFLRSDGAPALSQSIAPTWTGTHVFTGAPSRGGTSTQVSLGNASGAALIDLNSGAAGTDKKGVAIYKYSDGSFNIDFTNESVSDGRSVFSATPGTVGPSVGSLSFGNATDNPTYSFLGTGAGTSANPWTWSGTHIFNSSDSQIAVQNLSAGTNAKNWVMRANPAGDFALSSASDSSPGTAVQNVLIAARTGLTITNISLGNAVDNPTYSFLGTGAVTINGNAAVVGAGATSQIKMAAVKFTIGSGSCSPSGGFGFFGSCSRTGTGVVTAPFSFSFSSSPVCVGTAQATSFVVSLSTVSTTAVEFNVYDSTTGAAVTNSGVHIQCVGS